MAEPSRPEPVPPRWEWAGGETEEEADARWETYKKRVRQLIAEEEGQEQRTLDL